MHHILRLISVFLCVFFLGVDHTIHYDFLVRRLRKFFQKEYLTLDFFLRFGAGFGITRLEQACIQAGIFEQPIFSTSRAAEQNCVIESTLADKF